MSQASMSQASMSQALASCGAHRCVLVCGSACLPPQVFAAAGSDGSVRVYDEATGTQALELTHGDGVTTGGHSNGVFALAFKPDNPQVGSSTRTVRVLPEEPGVATHTWAAAVEHVRAVSGGCRRLGGRLWWFEVAEPRTTIAQALIRVDDHV